MPEPPVVESGGHHGPPVPAEASGIPARQRCLAARALPLDPVSQWNADRLQDWASTVQKFATPAPRHAAMKPRLPTDWPDDRATVIRSRIRTEHRSASLS